MDKNLFDKKGKCADCHEYVHLDELIEKHKNAYSCINCETDKLAIEIPKNKRGVKRWLLG